MGMTWNRDDVTSKVGRITGETFARLTFFAPIREERIYAFAPDQGTEAQEQLQEAIQSVE